MGGIGAKPGSGRGKERKNELADERGNELEWGAGRDCGTGFVDNGQRPTSMRRVQFKNWSDYEKAFDVLIDVGGTFLGRPEQVLEVTEAQYQALVAAKVVTPDGTEAPTRGTKAKKRAHR